MTLARPRVWDRKQLEVLAEDDEPEGSLELFKVSMTPRLLLLLMDYQASRGEPPVELVSVSSRDGDVAVRFFSRDVRPETADEMRGRVSSVLEREMAVGVSLGRRRGYERALALMRGGDA